MNSSSPLVDLDVVFADDELVDAIAARPWGARQGSQQGVHGGGGLVRFPVESTRGNLLTRDPLTELFVQWRDELAMDPLPNPPPVLNVITGTEPGRLPAKRSMRAALSIAAAIAALLVGTTSVGSKDAAPDSALWVITEVLWPNRAQSVESVHQVEVALAEARTALQEGRSQEAQLALLRAAVELGNVEEVDGRGDIAEQVASLWVVATPPEFATEPKQSEVVNVARSATAGSRPQTEVARTVAALLALAAVESEVAATQAAAEIAIGAFSPNPADAGSRQRIAIAAESLGAPPVEGSSGLPQAPEPGWATSGIIPSVATSPDSMSAPEAVPAPMAAEVPPAPATGEQPPPPASEPSAMPMPAPPVDPPAELPTEPPSATEQSPPTPSAPAPVDEVAVPLAVAATEPPVLVQSAETGAAG